MSSATQKQQTFVLIAAILASSMAFIDSTALNVALPALQNSLGLTAAQLLWVVNAYTLFLAALTLLGGSLGDVFGKRKIFLIGIVSFTVFSAACGLAQDGLMLIVFRALQGVGAALMVPGSLSIISAVFSQETRGQAIGTWSMFSAFTTILGPMLGGLLADAGLWRAIFWINIPLGVISFILLSRIPEPVKSTGQRLDLWGALFATLSFAGLTLGFIEAGERGFDLWWIQASLVAGVVFLAAFVWREAKADHPMMPLALFRSSTFSGANAMTVFVYGALSGVLFFVPLNLIQVQGYDAAMAGLAVLPFGATIALLARVSGKWTDTVGPRLPLISGPLITGVGFLGFAFIGQTVGFSDFWTTFFPVLLVSGIGMGITVVPLTTAVMNCVADENTGIASGVNNTLSRLAGVLAIAILGALAIIQFQDHLMTKAGALDLGPSQLEYLSMEAEKLADTKPHPSWPASQVSATEVAVKESFLEVFGLIALISAVLCFLGAITSALMVRARPKTVSLKRT